MTKLTIFLERLAGYCLTGVTREHAMAFGYGTGANGKSMFMNTIADCLQDTRNGANGRVHRPEPDRHPTEIARLQGARLVRAVETEEGRRWAESKVKALTGRIGSRRGSCGRTFYFIPQFKLFVAGNHKPGLRRVDEAISPAPDLRAIHRYDPTSQNETRAYPTSWKAEEAWHPAMDDRRLPRMAGRRAECSRSCQREQPPNT